MLNHEKLFSGPLPTLIQVYSHLLLLASKELTEGVTEKTCVDMYAFKVLKDVIMDVHVFCKVQCFSQRSLQLCS